MFSAVVISLCRVGELYICNKISMYSRKTVCCFLNYIIYCLTITTKINCKHFAHSSLPSNNLIRESNM